MIAQALGRVGSICLLDGWSGMWMCHFLGQTLLHLQARHLAAASEPMDAAFQDLVSRPSVKRFGIDRGIHLKL